MKVKMNKKKLQAVFLGAILLIPAVAVAVPKAEADAATIEEIPQFIEGDVIYQPKLTGSGNGVPEGWLAVPETQVPWLEDQNGNNSGGWKNYDATNTKNSEIETSKFTYTEEGLAVSLGQQDFGIIFPALEDKDGNAVENYKYTLKVSVTKKQANSFGPITDFPGDTDYVAGTQFVVYDRAGGNSWRSWNWAKIVNRYAGRYNDNEVAWDNENAFSYTADNTVTITVYHYDGMNYYYANDKYLYSQKTMYTYDGATLNGIGLAFGNAGGLIIREIEVKEVIQKGVSDMMTFSDTSIRYCDAEGNTEGDDAQGLRFEASVDMTSDLYQHLTAEVSELGTYEAGQTYTSTCEKAKFGMLIVPEDLVPVSGILTKDTPTVSDTEATKFTISEDGKTLKFTVALLGIPVQQRDCRFTARAYVKWQEGDAWEYTYSKETITRSYSRVANTFYERIEKELIAKVSEGETKAKEYATAIRARLAQLFQKTKDFKGEEEKELTFALFADFHYMNGTYMSSIADMQSILDRAHGANASFIIHAGDFCNDYSGSPELFNTYLTNNYNLPALGIYGNHELESLNNSMQVVTPLLNNSIANQNVVWGTADGAIGDGSIAYYYYEVNGFRIIGLDTNYSYNKTTSKWEHNATATSSPASGNINKHALGPVQLEWLEDVLMDAANEDIPCVILSHAGFSGVWAHEMSSDATAVRELFAAANAKQPGTVLMAINGHIHTNHATVYEDVMYLDMNTVRNGWWQGVEQDIYINGETFKYIDYDADGNPIYETDKLLAELSYGDQTWFFKDPLSAIVRISSLGTITIEGATTSWISNVVPEVDVADGTEPEVTSGVYNIPLY